MSVTWVLDNGEYLVSSKNHLLMIMQNGSFTSNSVTYTPTGDVPTYLTASYKQTQDIDLESDTNCYSIGQLVGTLFSGSYNGSGYSISNFTAQNYTNTHRALFGVVSGGTFKDIVLKGSWDVTSTTDATNIAASLIAAASGTTTIERILVDTDIVCGGIALAYGGVVGTLTGSVSMTDVTMRGTVDSQARDYVGGIIGRVISGTHVLQNLRYMGTGDLTFLRSAGSDTGEHALGGVIGVISSAGEVQLTNALNAMTGNLITTVNCGGIVGINLQVDETKVTMTNLVNSMVGSITSNSNVTTGGIFGRGYVGTSANWYNIMVGDVPGGVMCGVYFGNTTMDTGVVAMNGNTGRLTAIPTNSASGTVVTQWATPDFGLTVNTSTPSETGTKPTSSPWGYTEDFPELPYLEMSATDSESNVSYVETPFNNITGNTTLYDNTYNVYVVGQVQTYYPVTVQFTSVTYILLKFDTTGEEVVSSVGITFAEDPYFLFKFTTSVYPYLSEVSWSGPSFSSYDIGLAEDGMTELLVREDLTGTTVVFYDLTPSTLYTLTLYTGTVSQTMIFTTLEETSANMVSMMGFIGNDLTEFNSTITQSITEFFSDALETLDEVTANVEYNGASSSNVITFVEQSETIAIEGKRGILLPFTPLAGASQVVTLELSDTTTTNVTFDESSSQITVNGVVYSVGDIFILDGKKATVASI